ncbi:MAG: outer membrane lipid asymmetry maintenance protein MlaD, partial [Desulfovibrionaceae bacterium]|nr:outer membrane lipid asymmetry maintenance protein MlaD [Desulfovibrionaceae bacterium]
SALRLPENLRLPADTIASVKTSGLIGDKFVNLSPGGSETLLNHGGEIEDTESAVDLESLIGKFAFGGV